MSNDLNETTAAVVAHVLLNQLGIIGTAARTLDERWEELPDPDRSRLLDIIDATVIAAIGCLEPLVRARPLA